MSLSYEREDIANAYIERIKDLVSGKRTMPEVKYQFSRAIDEIHASDLDGLCMWKVYFRRTVCDAPEISNDAALKFLRGRVIERAIGTEQEPIERDGIILTIDDIHPLYGMTEIKSVMKDSSKFDPLDAKAGYPHWITRIKAYCYANDVDRMNLVVYFLVGNMWIKKTKSVDLKAWELRFAKDELAENWAKLLDRRDALVAAFKAGEPPPATYAAKESWECKGCEMSVGCPKFNTY